MARLTLIPQRDETGEASGGGADSPVISPGSVAQLSPEDRREYERACERVVAMPSDMGWVFISIGVVGVILPGIPGWPFMIIGGSVLIPGGRKWLSRKMVREPGPALRVFVRMLNRFMDDFERDCQPSRGA